jgi:hypothetical protein
VRTRVKKVLLLFVIKYGQNLNTCLDSKRVNKKQQQQHHLNLDVGQSVQFLPAVLNISLIPVNISGMGAQTFLNTEIFFREIANTEVRQNDVSGVGGGWWRREGSM